MTGDERRGRQLVSIGDNEGISYTPDGIRSSKTVNGTKTEYLLNGTQILAQKTGSDLMWFFYDQQGNRIGMADGSNHFYYYIYNVQGDVIALADASTGKLAATYTYDAWGKIVKINGIDPEEVAESSIAKINPFRYRGYYYDHETGLYYLQSRYYDPEVGRFLNADRLVSTGQGVLGCNMVAYCNNNPIQYKDDNGDFCIQTAIIGGAINAGVSIMCSIFDAAEKHEQLNVGEMLFDASISFALGFVSNMNFVNSYEKAVNAFETGYSFVTTLSRGGTLEEAVVNAGDTYITNKIAGKAGKAVTGGVKKCVADSAGENIASGFVTMCTSALSKVGKGIMKMLFGGARNRTSTNPHQEVKIHALGA